MSGSTPARVAFVSDSMPERNGVGAYYADLIDQLAAVEQPRRFEISFLCPGGDARAKLRFPLPGDRTQRVFLPSPREFGRILRRLAPDVVVVATPGPFGLLGQRWARKLGATLIFGYHTDFAGVTDMYRFSLFRALSRGYFRRVDRLLFRRADWVLANSQSMIEQARASGAKRVRRIGTLLPRSLLEVPPSTPGADLKRIVFAGRLAPEKRLETVLEAAEALPGLEFVIAGDGPLKDSVRRRAGELSNLRYAGWLSREALMQELDAADALVLPSEFESFGNVALEAMARQRIAIVTGGCGIAHWRRLARHLVVFDAGEPLTEVLRALKRRPPCERAALAAGAREAAVALNAESLQQWIALLADPETENAAAGFDS